MRSLRCAFGWHLRVPDYDDSNLFRNGYRCLRCPARWDLVYLHGTGGHSSWVRMPEHSEGRPGRGYVSGRTPDRDKLRGLPRGPGPAGALPALLHTEGRRPDAVP
jgi:hypothetical protein